MPASLASLIIEGYRGFATKQTMRFAAPSGKRGSGLTAIVGANNAGKSSVIEAIRSFVAHETTFTEGRRNKTAGDRVKITLVDVQGKIRTVSSVASGGSETTFEPGDGRFGSELLGVPPRRQFAPFFSKASMPRNSYASQLGSGAMRGQTTEAFAYRLFGVQKDRKRFDDILSHILTPPP